MSSSVSVFPRSHQVACLVASIGWALFGVLLNPLFADVTSQTNACLSGIGLIGLVAVLAAFVRASRSSPEPLQAASAQPTTFVAWSILAVVLLAKLYLERWHWFSPRLIDDDLINLKLARDWATTQANLLRPFNEHLLVPTRLAAYVAVQFSTPATLPYALMAELWLLFAVACVLLFLLARREFRSDAAGLATVAVFSLTYVHHECFWWFMAGQWWWTTILLLTTLLILDPAKPTRGRAMAAAVLAAAAPFTFSIGLVVGPVAALWICCRWPSERRWAWAPVVGSILGLAVTAPLIKYGLRPEDLETSNVKLKWFELDLWNGLGFSARLAAEHLVLHNLGLSPGRWSAGVSGAVFVATVAGLIAVLSRRPDCWRLAPFLSLVLLTYGLVVPFRAWMDYQQMTTWTARYQLLPHLGLACFLVGAATPAGGSRTLTQRGAFFILALIVALVVLQESTHGGWVWRP